MPRTAPLLLLLAISTTACAAAMRGCFSSSGGRGDSDDEPPPPEPPPIVLGACAGIGGSDEPCRATVPREALSQGSRRDQLVVFFPGDGGDCGLFARLASDLLRSGSLPVCIDVHETFEQTTTASVPARGERARAALAELGRTAEIRAAWTGAEVVFVAEGLAASVLVLAATEASEPPFLRGDRRTAACLFDGSFDAGASRDALLRGGPAVRPCIPRGPAAPPFARWCPGLLTGAAELTAATCGVGTGEAITADSVLPIDPTVLELDELVVVDCGSELPVCTGDVFPAEPADRFCRAVDSRGASGEGTPRCSRESSPRTPHARCVATTLPQCLERLAGGGEPAGVIRSPDN